MSPRKVKPWPTKRLPKCPVSGDPTTWTKAERAQFHKWALSLKAYPGPGPSKQEDRP